VRTRELGLIKRYNHLYSTGSSITSLPPPPPPYLPPPHLASIDRVPHTAYFADNSALVIQLGESGLLDDGAIKEGEAAPTCSSSGGSREWK